MKFNLIILIATSFLMIRCGSSDKTMTTKSGYDFAIVHDENGATANPGDFVYFEMDIKDDKGKVLQSMRGLPQMPVLQIPEEELKNTEPNPLVDMLAEGSVGDTMSLIIPKDSMPSRPGMDDMMFAEYLVDIKEILSKEDYTQRLAKEKEEADAKLAISKARESDVAELVKTTLASYKAGKLKGLQKGEQGLEYYIHEKGDGPKLEQGKMLTAMYYGVLESDGSMFDNSFSRGQGYPFALGTGAVIQGWHVGFANLSKGDKATLFIPYELAYGEAGRPGIPAKADLVFYVEVE